MTLNFDGVNKTVNTPCGGFLSVLSIIFVIIYSLTELSKIYQNEILVFSYSPTASLDGGLNLTKFDDSFNMIIALEGAAGFDWKDNPFISASIYEPKMDGHGEAVLDHDGKVQIQKATGASLDYCGTPDMF